MVFAATVVKVLIASPGDTAELRDTVEEVLHEWNGMRSGGAAVVLLPRRWETDAVAEYTDTDGQSVINAQLVYDADIVIGVFHSRLGTATPRAASGTAEELGRSQEAGKRVHVYFSDMPIAHDHDRAALAALDEFKRALRERGLFGSFDSPTALQAQVRRAIEHDLTILDLGARPAGGSRGAALRATFAYDREPDNRGRIRSTRERIELVNEGREAAEGVTYEILPVGKNNHGPLIHHDGEPFTIAPNGGTFVIAVLRYAGTADNIQLHLRWSEGGAQRSSQQTVALR
ncbi:hypothetical protein [Microbacterium sp.]|uniref:hypothetical protein n=1 Tax=Microbacterium sp. TaxID=51671 RepID=UPI003C76A200